ncbi:MAG TPA: squalene/phytoene synthase family protein [Allosphingosinicella sp.]|jgi:phytoene synthase
MAELDPDRILALSYIPARVRPAVEALWQLDAALAAVLTGGRDPLLSQIKLAWWRDALEQLDTGGRPPAEPVLEAVAALVLPLGITGTELSAMELGWTLLLTPDPLTADELNRFAAARGGLLFRYSACLLGGESADVEAGGEAWALIDLARHSGSEVDAEAAIAAAAARRWGKWPSPLRPLGMLAVLAARDAARGAGGWEIQGAPTRMLQMLKVRLLGR